MPATKGLIVKPVRTGTSNMISFEIVDRDRTVDKLTAFYRQLWANQEKYQKEYEIEMDLAVWYRPRTLLQNNLLRALERIASRETYETDAHYEEFHEGLVDVYCPLKECLACGGNDWQCKACGGTGIDKNPITGRSRQKRTHELNTIEMSRVIGGAFHELLMMGLNVDSAAKVQRYWIEWNSWRGRQAVDPFSQAFVDIEEYRRAVTYCEACLRGLMATDEHGVEAHLGALAHIVSRGAGGSDELWNRLMLCDDCHNAVQHLQGWAAMVTKFSHLTWKIAQARLQAGRLAIEEIQQVDGMEAVLKEIEKKGHGAKEAHALEASQEEEENHRV